MQNRQIMHLTLDLPLDTLGDGDAPIPREEFQDAQPTFDGEMPQRPGVEYQRSLVQGH
jgi:hypothetical protein